MLEILFITLLSLLIFIVPVIIIGIFLNINIMNFGISKNKEKEKLLVFFNWFITICTGFGIIISNMSNIFYSVNYSLNSDMYLHLLYESGNILAESMIISCAIMTILLIFILIGWSIKGMIYYKDNNHKEVCENIDSFKLKDDQIFTKLLNKIYLFNQMFVKK